MNLLELPMLFYIVCLVLYVTGGASSIAIAIACVLAVFTIPRVRPSSATDSAEAQPQPA